MGPQLPLPPPASGLMPNSGPLAPSRSGLQVYAPRTEAGPSNARAGRSELNPRERVSGNSGYNVPREAEGAALAIARILLNATTRPGARALSN